jgi:hypothetical protein
MLFRLPFGVPLDADDELRRVVVAQAFDHAVRRRRFHDQPLAQAIHTLTVQRVDHHLVLPGEGLEEAARRELDQVLESEDLFRRDIVVLRSAMIVLAGQLMDAVMQRAAQGDVDFLDAAADAEHRHARGDARAHERQHECIAPRIDDLIGRKRRPIVVMRFDVRPSTREQDAVHA